MPSPGWSRDQLLKALALYCQIPFGKMHSGNPEVVALAAEIGRTPSAVAFKPANFASLDPELRHRGVGGMGNTSQLDRDIWQEFYGRWEALAENGFVIEPPAAIESAQKDRAQPRSAPTGPTELLRETSIHRGQHCFRASVLAAHDSRCCITGITSEPLLRASHIVPWSQDPTQRLNPHNGLCLNALHDAAFDRGLITLSEKFELRLSKRLKKEVPEPIYKDMFESHTGTPIAIPERFKPDPAFVAFHRERVFRVA